MNAVQVTNDILVSLQSMAIADTYMIVPSQGIDAVSIREYWEALADADLLKYRYPDTDVSDFELAIKDFAQFPRFFVLDCSTGETKAEFALTNQTGKSAQIHFSMHPSNSSALNVLLADRVGDEILFGWKEIENLERHLFDSLYGLTPVPNRAACIFVLKAGMKKVGILPGGSMYFGNIVDAMITVRSRN